MSKFIQLGSGGGGGGSGGRRQSGGLRGVFRRVAQGARNIGSRIAGVFRR